MDTETCFCVYIINIWFYSPLEFWWFSSIIFYMKPSWESNSHWVSQAFLVHFMVSEGWLLCVQEAATGPYPETGHSFKPHFFKNLFIIILWSCWKVFLIKMLWLCPSHLILHRFMTSVIWWRVQIMNLLVMHFCLSSCYFLHLRSKS
jgi:hypothetical protein